MLKFIKQELSESFVRFLVTWTFLCLGETPNIWNSYDSPTSEDTTRLGYHII